MLPTGTCGVAPAFYNLVTGYRAGPSYHSATSMWKYMAKMLRVFQILEETFVSLSRVTIMSACITRVTLKLQRRCLSKERAGSFLTVVYCLLAI
jgi:hypothetical protein